MWTCLKCEESLDDNFDICWNAVPIVRATKLLVSFPMSRKSPGQHPKDRHALLRSGSSV